MKEGKDTIAYLSNFITELKKQNLDKKGREILQITEKILRKEVALQNELSELKNDKKRNMIKSSQIAQFYSHTPKNKKDELITENLSKHNLNLNRILNLATTLIMKDKEK